MATPKAQTRKKDQSGSPGTPLSPSLVTRRDEKDQMVNLNNRLAIYIDKIRSLETENHRLQVQINSYEETSTTEITNLKGMYENEISEARRLLDELAKEKAQLQIEGSSLRDRADAEKTRADALSHDNSVLEIKLKEISKRMRTKEVQTANAIKERDDAVEELDSVKGKIADLTQELETTRQMLEQETLQRVDYENKLQSLKEELHFKEKLHQEEVKESRKRHAVSVTEIDERVKCDYESKMEAALADLREQQAYDMDQLKEDLEGQYKLKISALRSQTDGARRALMQIQEGNKSSELKIDRLQTSVQLMQNENNILCNKIRDLEGKLESAEELKRAAVTVVERERNEARNRLEEMEGEYAELLNLKLNLDMEIATYRKLLEEEEARLNISPSPAGESKSRTRAGRKRKRATQIESQQISQKAKKQDSTMTITSETVTVEQTTRQRVEGDPETGDEKTCTIM